MIELQMIVMARLTLFTDNKSFFAQGFFLQLILPYLYTLLIQYSYCINNNCFY